MNNLICRSILVVLLIVANSPNGVAQQPTSSKTVPSLSSDGVITRKNVDRTEVGWRRYAPEGFGISFELPGEPLQRTYPIPPGLQTEILESKVLDYVEDGLSVNLAHVVFSTRQDLRLLAEDIKRSMLHSDTFQNPKISLVPKGDRVLMRGSFLMFGNEVEMRGIVAGSGDHMWFVSVQTRRDKLDGEAICSRILESVTIRR